MYNILKLKFISTIICETLDDLNENKTYTNDEILLDTHYSNLSLSNDRIPLSEMKWLRDSISQYTILSDETIRQYEKLSRYEFGILRKETIREIAKKNDSTRNYLLH